jgi:hypothetical protein
MLSDLKISTFCFFVLIPAFAFSQKRPIHVSSLDPKQPINTCIAEVNAQKAAPVDVACAMPSDAIYRFELYAKDKDQDSGGWNWKRCETAGLFQCNGVSAGWAAFGEYSEEPGMISIQMRFVPAEGTKRGRLKVEYQTPMPTKK